MSIGAWLAGKCNVYDSNMRVIRYVRSCMKKPQRNDPLMRDERKQVYRDALAAHAENRKLFVAMARGDIG